MRNKADQISGCFWLIFSVFITVESYRKGLGTLHRPGSGFLYFWLGVALGLMSIVILIRARVNKKAGETKSPIFGRQENMLKIFLVLFSVFLYIFFIETLGFISVTLLFFLVLLGLIEKKKWGLTIFFSLLVTVVAYLIFGVFLDSQLPKGLFGF